jgi:hypothetical protein
MIQLVLFLAVAALLFLALIFLARRGARAEGGGEALVEARQALNHLQADLLPPELVARIFAKDDFEYVALAGPKRVRRMFLAERTRIAGLWVGEVRRQVANLRRFHLGTARHYSRLSLRKETELAVNFAVLLFACNVLHVLIRVRGPLAAIGMVRTTAAAAERVSTISEKGLAFMNPAPLRPLARPPAGPAAL